MALVAFYIQRKNQITLGFLMLSRGNGWNGLKKVCLNSSVIRQMWNSKRVLQESKACQIFRKTNISYRLIRTRTCAYHGVINFRFFVNFGFFFFFFFVTLVLRFALLPYYRRSFIRWIIKIRNTAYVFFLTRNLLGNRCKFAPGSMWNRCFGYISHVLHTLKKIKR